MKHVNIGLIPADLHKECRIQALREDKSIKQWIIDVLTKFIKERKEGEK